MFIKEQVKFILSLGYVRRVLLRDEGLFNTVILSRLAWMYVRLGTFPSMQIFLRVFVVLWKCFAFFSRATIEFPFENFVSPLNQRTRGGRASGIKIGDLNSAVGPVVVVLMNVELADAFLAVTSELWRGSH